MSAPPRPVFSRTGALRPGRPRFLWALVGLVFLLACSDEGPVSGPGTLTATLIGPNGAEGAAVLALLGDGVESVTPVGPTEVHARPGDSQLRLVLIHPDGGELSFRVSVADTTAPPAFVIEEVAGPDDELRTDVDAYGLEFSR